MSSCCVPEPPKNFGASRNIKKRKPQLACIMHDYENEMVVQQQFAHCYLGTGAWTQ